MPRLLGRRRMSLAESAESTEKAEASSSSSASSAFSARDILLPAVDSMAAVASSGVRPVAETDVALDGVNEAPQVDAAGNLDGAEAFGVVVEDLHVEQHVATLPQP